MQALYEDCLCQQLYYGLCLVRSYFLDSHPNKEDTCIKKEKKKPYADLALSAVECILSLSSLCSVSQTCVLSFL